MAASNLTADRIFGVIVHGKEIRGSDKSIFTKAGERFWVMIDHDEWVEATSSRVNYHNGAIPGDIKTFNTRKDAEKFARHWKGHPWDCKPNGTFEIVEVIPRKVVEAKIVGYEVIHNKEFSK